jgi:hypothetical protein
MPSVLPRPASPRPGPRHDAAEGPRHDAAEGPRHDAAEGPRHDAAEGPRHDAAEGPRHDAAEGPRHERKFPNSRHTDIEQDVAAGGPLGTTKWATRTLDWSVPGLLWPRIGRATRPNRTSDALFAPRPLPNVALMCNRQECAASAARVGGERQFARRRAVPFARRGAAQLAKERWIVDGSGSGRSGRTWATQSRSARTLVSKAISSQGISAGA